MAMNKKEQAEMAALRRAVLVAGAFVRTPSVRPDLPPPDRSGSGQKYTEGFNYNVHTRAVYEAWSDSSYQGRGRAPEDGKYRSASQNPVSLFSTRLLALQALRAAVEIKVANELADIDAEIEREIAAAAPQTKKG